MLRRPPLGATGVASVGDRRDGLCCGLADLWGSFCWGPASAGGRLDGLIWGPPGNNHAP